MLHLLSSFSLCPEDELFFSMPRKKATMISMPNDPIAAGKITYVLKIANRVNSCSWLGIKYAPTNIGTETASNDVR